MKKTIQKLLSVVLVMAICISTVCGVIIPASAATTDPTYTIVGDAVAAGTKTTTMTVTITNPNGIRSGSFDLMFGSDVIDDVNFNTTTDANGNVTYNGYAENPDYVTLEEFLGTRQETSVVTSEYDWNKVDTGTATQWATSDPDGNEPEWQSTGNTRQQDNYVAVSGTTEWATSDPDGDGKVWQATGDSKKEDNWTESTVNLKLSEVPADTATVKYVQGAKVQDNWTADYTQNFKYGERPDTSTGEWKYTNSTVQGTTPLETKEVFAIGGTAPTSDDYYIWVQTGEASMSNWYNTYTKYDKLYVYQHYSNNPTYTYTKRVNNPITKYEYQKHENKPYTETEYAKHVITYYEYVDGFDTDNNNMINTTNVYKTVNVYDENGNVTGTTEVVDSAATKKNSENISNKGTLLPNAFDMTNGLFNTKIEITGGKPLNDGEEFALSDFTGSKYTNATTIEDNAGTSAIEGKTDSREYAYNITDDYATANNVQLDYEDITVTENDETKTVSAPKVNDNLLNYYYREYTTVDVATPNLDYAISTVSEDTVSTMPKYTQYAQGFKNITFNSSKVYESITFTVTLDFTGICDRISAHDGLDEDVLAAVTHKYGKVDGRWGSENYVGYGKKYQLNLLHASGDIKDVASASTNVNNDFVHVHGGTIYEETGKADPVNKAAIDALKAKNPDAKEGIDYFELYNATCSICKRVTPMLVAQDLPYKVSRVNADGTTSRVDAPEGEKGSYDFNNYRNISGINLTYNNDGSVSLNIHYPSSMEGEQMIITDENGIVLDYSDVVETGYNGVKEDTTAKHTPVESFFKSKRVTDTKIDENGKEVVIKDYAKYSGTLMTTATMISVDGISASEADKTLYIARYTPQSKTETQLMGITHSISLVEYCNEVIKGDNVYYLEEDYSQSNIDADKMVAAAFINYAHASKTALTTPNDYKTFDKTDAWEANASFNKQWDQWNLLDGKLDDNGETGENWENAIIIDTAEEFAYLNKVGGADTYGKYYKVADGIKYFDMSSGKVDLSKTLDENINTIKAGYNFSGSANGFQGHLDGNGVTVYGIYNPGSYTGLFSYTKGDVTIKNVNVTMSYFEGSTCAGGIIGFHQKYSSTDPGSLTIENCSVTNCHIQSNGNANGAGALAGVVQTWGNSINGLTEVKNCYVNLDPAHFITTNTNTAIMGGLITSSSSGNTFFSNCISIGVKPYSTWNGTNKANQNSLSTHFTDVYTDQDVDKGVSFDEAQDYTDRITKLDLANMQGDVAKTNMPNLDWDLTWQTTTDGYPKLYTPYNKPKNAEKTIYWDGKVASGFTSTAAGTKADPIIINTASELAYLVSSGHSVSLDANNNPKYFKIADGIKNIVLQPKEYVAEIIALDSASATKTYFEYGTFEKWVEKSWEATSFCGYFDGNGATVYGLYSVSASNAGLFSSIDAGASIHDIAVKNSYIVSASPSANYQVGAIAAVSNSTSSSATYGLKTNGIVWVEGCTVANCYMRNNATLNTRSGVILGSMNDGAYVDCCLVYGNDAYYSDGAYPMSLVGGAHNSLTSDVRCPAELTIKLGYDENKDVYYHVNAIRNTVALGTAPYDTNKDWSARINTNEAYENVYTDCADGTVQLKNKSITYTISQIKQIKTSDIGGISARTAMSELDWYDAKTNPDGKWYCSYLGAMPSLSPINESISTLYPAYDTITFTEDESAFNSDSVFYQLHENKSMTFGVYATAMNLKANPYMSFAFALYGDYKTNRDKVSITFKYTVNGIEYVYGDEEAERAALAIPKYVENEPIRSVNGWTNTSGRYHTYKFTGVPVEALVNGIKVYASYEGDAVNAAFTDEYLGTYSISGLGYDFDKLDTEESSSQYYRTRAEAAKALMFYVQAIHTRYGDK
ncbi:MAG: hypothetical protein IKK65_03240 [Clostridia bacterium]|nr:hypothetical protein [Clostridia bacterium]